MLGFVGAHRTGKTTLANKYSQSYGVKVVEMNITEIQREIGYNSANQEYDIDSRLMVQEYVLERFCAIYDDIDDNQAVCDRTPLDLIGYTLCAVNDSLTAEQSDRLQRYIQNCIEATNKYFTAILLIQPAIALVEKAGSAKNCLGFIEKLNTIYLGVISDPRVLVTKRFLPRGVVKLDDRVRSARLTFETAINNSIHSRSILNTICGVEIATLIAS